MSVAADPVAAGQAVYTRRVLRAYAFFVLGLSDRFIWNCPTSRLLEHYDRYVSANHLELRRRFSDVVLYRVGCAALFAARA